MIYKEQFKIGLKDVGINNQINNKAILECLENIAAYHSDSVGYGIHTSHITNLAWVLLDWKLNVIKRPKYGQTMNINTWSRGISKFYAYRDFEIYDDENNLCAIATSKWLLLNSKTGKISKAEKEMADKYKSEIDKCVFKEKEIEKLSEPKEYENSIIYEVKRRDIDVLKHMHNLYYLDLAYEVLPEELYDKKPFSKVRITYKKEVKLNDILICKFSRNNDIYTIVIKSKDEKTLHSIIEIKK